MRSTVVFSADITVASAQNFATILSNMVSQKYTHLTIGINSTGGGVQPGVFLHNLLISMPMEITTHNIGNVDSIANVVFLGGSHRRSCHSSTFMFHGVGFDLSGNVRMEEKNLTELLDSVNADHDRISRIISSRTELAVEDCRQLFSQQKTRGAEWALENGMVHEICDFSMPSDGSGFVFTGALG
ncbi:hypothetical protein DEM27_10365 [Metarhizobium album]|uniref:ATP-dependent Clp protease proteolytic subunit n=1 Tax=Metarhizobium album TaxID=2182425 RepID=A0A2U2DTY3_9HYPH|nr:ATP-dependent Clp protease proteolytic subunit [Rhizobium album]PWE56757.1 hypothetical protein DEM27_10365 [Rhizobium album]